MSRGIRHARADDVAGSVEVKLETDVAFQSLGQGPGGVRGIGMSLQTGRGQRFNGRRACPLRQRRALDDGHRGERNGEETGERQRAGRHTRRPPVA